MEPSIRSHQKKSFVCLVRSSQCLEFDVFYESWFVLHEKLFHKIYLGVNFTFFERRLNVLLTMFIIGKDENKSIMVIPSSVSGITIQGSDASRQDV